VLCYPRHNGSSFAPDRDPDATWSGPTDPKDSRDDEGSCDKAETQTPGMQEEKCSGVPDTPAHNKASTLRQRAHCTPNEIRAARQGMGRKASQIFDPHSKS